MVDAIEKVPAETRWATAAQAMEGVIIAHMKALRDIAGEERFHQIQQQIWSKAGGGVKMLKDTFGLPGDDAEAAAEVLTFAAILTMGPECKFEFPERGKDKAVVKITECPWLNRTKEVGIELDLCSHADHAYADAVVKSVNPKLAQSLTKSMVRGDPYCEWVIELQK